MKRYFITGTDTDCGKTYVTCKLLEFFNENQKYALALKPIASGYDLLQKKENLDLIHLQKNNNLFVKNYTNKYQINKWLFPEPISPHLAASLAGIELSLEELAAWCLNYQFEGEYLLIEGAGGLLVPLNANKSWLDFLKLTELPIILVVSLRLGCLNHALLTDYVLKTQQTNYVGWVANCMDPEMLYLKENIETLIKKMHAPLLAKMPFNGKLMITDAFNKVFN